MLAEIYRIIPHYRRIIKRMEETELIFLKTVPKLIDCHHRTNFFLTIKTVQRYEGNASIFLSKCHCNNNQIYVDDLYKFSNYKAIFSQSLRDFQHTFANVE
jgi:hypothetical protein